MAKYTVKQGDCISSIAQKKGLFWKQLWNHPENASLKSLRKDPNVLRPGDQVFVPDKQGKQVSGATDQEHRFRVKGVPAKLRVQVLDEDQPRANEPYTLEIDGNLYSGTTDGEGRIEHSIPPDAKQGRLLVGDTQDEYPLSLGHMDPVEEVAGVQARLNNLGFNCGEVNGRLGPETEAALKAFQKKHNLSETGEIDQATRDKLKEVHGS